MGKKNQDVFEKLISDTKKSLENLNIAVAIVGAKKEEEGRTQLFLDGLFKRFELLFVEIVHLLKLAVSQEGIDVISPLQAIQEAVRLNWIKDSDFWLVALDARNSSANGLNDFSKRDLLNIISQFATETEIIINLIKELRT